MITVSLSQKNDEVRKKYLLFILLKSFILLDFCFSTTFVNLLFLPFTVYVNSSLFELEKGRICLVQMMQNHLVFFSFWRNLFACLIYYIHDEPMCHECHIVYSNDF